MYASLSFADVYPGMVQTGAMMGGCSGWEVDETENDKKVNIRTSKSRETDSDTGVLNRK